MERTSTSFIAIFKNDENYFMIIIDHNLYSKINTVFNKKIIQENMPINFIQYITDNLWKLKVKEYKDLNLYNKTRTFKSNDKSKRKINFGELKNWTYDNLIEDVSLIFYNYQFCDFKILKEEYEQKNENVVKYRDSIINKKNSIKVQLIQWLVYKIRYDSSKLRINKNHILVLPTLKFRKKNNIFEFINCFRENLLEIINTNPSENNIFFWKNVNKEEENYIELFKKIIDIEANNLLKKNVQNNSEKKSGEILFTLYEFWFDLSSQWFDINDKYFFSKIHFNYESTSNNSKEKFVKESWHEISNYYKNENSFIQKLFIIFWIKKYYKDSIKKGGFQVKCFLEYLKNDIIYKKRCFYNDFYIKIDKDRYYFRDCKFVLRFVKKGEKNLKLLSSGIQ